jgi:hypothetical protein
VALIESRAQGPSTRRTSSTGTKDVWVLSSHDQCSNYERREKAHGCVEVLCLIALRKDLGG